MRLGIIGCANIAYRRFIPATKFIDDLEVVAIAEEYDKEKLKIFCNDFNLEGMTSFSELIKRKDLDAVYVPQPPALHYKWAMMALDVGKHVLVEKPSTTSLNSSLVLVLKASSCRRALHENYMFQYHSQISRILEYLNNGSIGDIRMYRLSFGFPMRPESDFRYNKHLGGGALFDAGGYTLKLANILLGDSIKVEAAHISYLDDFEVDIYGSAYLSNQNGQICEIAFGMDCGYQCSLEAWGSKGVLRAERVFTAPEGYNPSIIIEINGSKQIIQLEADSHFKKSIEKFVQETQNDRDRELMYQEIINQARLVDEVKRMARK